MDTIAVDAWLPVGSEYWTSGLYRVSPDGEVSESMLTQSEVRYAMGGLGRGIGGWRPDAIYMPEPYNTLKVREVVIGIPDGRGSAPERRTGRPMRPHVSSRSGCLRR